MVRGGEMKDVILMITCSLDGFIAAEDGNVDWLLQDEDYDFDAFLHKVDILLMGHKTYSQVLSFGKWPYEGKECYVFTKQHRYPENDRVIFSDDPVGTTENLMLGTGGGNMGCRRCIHHFPASQQKPYQ